MGLMDDVKGFESLELGKGKALISSAISSLGSFLTQSASDAPLAPIEKDVMDLIASVIPGAAASDLLPFFEGLASSAEAKVNPELLAKYDAVVQAAVLRLQAAL